MTDQEFPTGDGIDWFDELVGTARALASAPDYPASIRLGRRAAAAPDSVPGLRRLRVGILSNVTVDPWLPELQASLLRRHFIADFWVGDFGVVEPYLLGQGLPELDLLWVHFDGDTLAGDARHDPSPEIQELLVDRLAQVVRAAEATVPCSVVISTLAQGHRTLPTPLVDQGTAEWPAVRARLNGALRQEVGRASTVHVFDIERLVSEVGALAALDHRLAITSRSPWSLGFLPSLGDALADLASALFSPPRKCVVVDCDNTLWGGVLGEDGPQGVALGPDYPGSEYREFQFFLRRLRRSGFLLAINSKNNPEDVEDFIRSSPNMVLRPDDFAASRVNWDDKASNLRSIAAELNIGLDSIVFVDDSPVECAWVRRELPEVQVEAFPDNALGIYDFCAQIQGLERVSVTESDRLRTESIRADVHRRRLLADAPDMESFVRDLAIEVRITRQDTDDALRISQLTQRTNQFNLTTRRYSADEIRQWTQEGVVYSMAMRDRFSEYGTIGVAIAVPEQRTRWRIDTFLLSCRAFGRGVEAALLDAVLLDLEARGVEWVSAEWLATSKNQMTRDFFPSNHFEITFEGEAEARFGITLQNRPRPPHFPYEIERVGF